MLWASVIIATAITFITVRLLLQIASSTQSAHVSLRRGGPLNPVIFEPCSELEEQAARYLWTVKNSGLILNEKLQHCARTDHWIDSFIWSYTFRSNCKSARFFLGSNTPKTGGKAVAIFAEPDNRECQDLPGGVSTCRLRCGPALHVLLSLVLC